MRMFKNLEEIWEKRVTTLIYVLITPKKRLSYSAYLSSGLLTTVIAIILIRNCFNIIIKN